MELKEKRTWKCEDEGKKCAWGNFTSRKIRRMHRETASEMGSLPWSQNNGKENAARIKVSTRGPGSSWSYWCTKQLATQQLATKCLVIVQGDCSNPINERALSLGPRLSLFSEASYRPFPHYASVSKYKEIRTRLGWTISYKSLYFVLQSLELVRLFTGIRERSVDLVCKNVFFTFSVLPSIEYRDEALPTCLDDTNEQTVSSL